MAYGRTRRSKRIFSKSPVTEILTAKKSAVLLSSITSPSTTKSGWCGGYGFDALPECPTQSAEVVETVVAGSQNADVARTVRDGACA
jgi:hypothetical protein